MNDAIATTPQATLAALRAYAEEVDTLFLGGKDGNYDFTELVQYIKKSSVRTIVFFPDTGVELQALLQDKEYTTLFTSSMQEAVAFAYQHTQAGKVCLLSCAGPSYSVWKNFEEKGDLFVYRIQEMNVK